VLPSPLLFNTETPDLLRALSRAEGAVENLPFTKYLVKMATLLRDHLQTNVSDETIQKDMVDVVLYMQGLSKVCVCVSSLFGSLTIEPPVDIR
jgi:hypothetical protein